MGSQRRRAVWAGRCLIVAILLLGMSAFAAAEWVPVPVSEDASVISHSPDKNYNNCYPGCGPLWSGEFYNNDTWFLTRFYLQFKLPEIQPDQYLASATLWGYYWQSDDTQVPKQKHDIYFVPDDNWTEAGITWNNQPLLNPTPPPIAVLDPAIQTLGWVSWDIKPTVVSEYDGDDHSLSLMFKVNDETIDQKKSGAYFRESESFPECSFLICLDVRTIPSPSVFVGLLSMGLTGLVALMWRRRRQAASR